MLSRTLFLTGVLVAVAGCGREPSAADLTDDEPAEAAAPDQCKASKADPTPAPEAGSCYRPRIASISPAFGPPGSEVHIKGAGFGKSQGLSALTFNAIEAVPDFQGLEARPGGDIISWSETEIVAKVPDRAANEPDHPAQVVVSCGDVRWRELARIRVPFLMYLDSNAASFDIRRPGSDIDLGFWVFRMATFGNEHIFTDDPISPCNVHAGHCQTQTDRACDRNDLDFGKYGISSSQCAGMGVPWGGEAYNGRSTPGLDLDGDGKLDVPGGVLENAELLGLHAEQNRDLETGNFPEALMLYGEDVELSDSSGYVGLRRVRNDPGEVRYGITCAFCHNGDSLEGLPRAELPGDGAGGAGGNAPAGPQGYPLAGGGAAGSQGGGPEHVEAGPDVLGPDPNHPVPMGEGSTAQEGLWGMVTRLFRGKSSPTGGAAPGAGGSVSYGGAGGAAPGAGGSVSYGGAGGAAPGAGGASYGAGTSGPAASAGAAGPLYKFGSPGPSYGDGVVNPAYRSGTTGAPQASAGTTHAYGGSSPAVSAPAPVGAPRPPSEGGSMVPTLPASLGGPGDPIGGSTAPWVFPTAPGPGPLPATGGRTAPRPGGAPGVEVNNIKPRAPSTPDKLPPPPPTAGDVGNRKQPGPVQNGMTNRDVRVGVILANSRLVQILDDIDPLPDGRTRRKILIEGGAGRFDFHGFPRFPSDTTFEAVPVPHHLGTTGFTRMLYSDRVDRSPLAEVQRRSTQQALFDSRNVGALLNARAFRGVIDRANAQLGAMRALAIYLNATQEPFRVRALLAKRAIADSSIDQKLVQKGRQVFECHGCVNCHSPHLGRYTSLAVIPLSAIGTDPRHALARGNEFEGEGEFMPLPVSEGALRASLPGLQYILELNLITSPKGPRDLRDRFKPLIVRMESPTLDGQPATLMAGEGIEGGLKVQPAVGPGPVLLNGKRDESRLTFTADQVVLEAEGGRLTLSGVTLTGMIHPDGSTWGAPMGDNRQSEIRGRVTASSLKEIPAGGMFAAYVSGVREDLFPGLRLPPSVTSIGYRVPKLVGLGYKVGFLHDGSLKSLSDMMDPARFKKGYKPTGFDQVPPGFEGVPGHQFTLLEDADERAALLAFLSTL